MAYFGDNFDDTEVDPAAEFLAREQDQLAGLEDELRPAAATLTNGTAPLDGTGSFEMINTLGHTDIPFDTVSSSNENCGYVAPDHSFDFLSAETVPGEAVPSSHTDMPETSTQPAPQKPTAREEPEKIKKWREDQKTRLEEKDANEEKKKAEMREAAKKELEEWYRHHEELIAKTKADNRNAEKQFVAEAGTIVPGTEWERIAKLCDFNPKASRTSKDVSRMRSIILQLKQNPPAQVTVKH